MKFITEKPVGAPFNIAIVVSQFNEEVTNGLLEGALERLNELNVKEERITVVKVPGAVEIPLVLQRLAHIKYYEVLVALGAVIRGETSHYDYVCKQVSDGCLKVSLENDIPVIFGVLTTDTEEQALARVGGDFGHKGREAIDAAINMISVLRQI